ncbi:rho GTPase-activating protein 6-like [Conger conger]|uniref:rho GTPase-activating protein 6-like n=1 Tax=Conger conger TaxID=82655 RepID=UPI002A5A2C63|nr:rho GTPase-activating protein 6-like [Conger conger]
MLGPGVRLQPVHIQNLSELERARLQEIAHCRLEERELDFKISIPRENRKRRKSLRKRFDSFSKEKKEKEKAPKAFGVPLSQVIANDRAHKQRLDALKDCLDPEASAQGFRAQQQQLSNRPALSLSPTPTQDPSTCPLSPTPLTVALPSHRRGGLSVDCISELVESQSLLLEALQLSHPHELDGKKAAGRAQTKLSLNPVCHQVPRVLEQCCRHIEAHGLQTLGIFRVGSSKKRIRQLREDFDQGVDVVLDAEHSVHDIAALLKEFLRDMPDPLLPRELYTAFLHTNSLRGADQLSYLQHLLYLLPPCHCDTLLRLLALLHTVQRHAQDSVSPDSQAIPGNKMTAMNLAVIFGPNLLQRERGSERDLRATNIEDSTAIISITLLLIQKYRLLFMVSAALQQEVLLSILQTDPDIMNYLLRRKLSCGHQRVETEASRGGVLSVGLSSGELSPLDPPNHLFPESQADSCFSSKVFLRVLQLNQNRKRTTSDRPQRSMAQIRQFHSHHNLMSLARPMLSPDNDPAPKGSLEGEEPPGEGGAMGGAFSPAERTVLFSLGLDPNTSPLPLSPRDTEKAQPTHFWDFFSRKASSSENTV